MRALLLILYCTGMRFGEAVRLEGRDVDLRRRVFCVRESKGKTRWVPFRADLGRELQAYLRRRGTLVADATGDRFLVRDDGRAFTLRAASDLVRGMLRRLKLKPPRGRVGPRPYDMRHTFAVHRLSAWHRAGVTSVHARLPELSAYLGHDDVMGTEVYLNATPELIHMAARRLRSRLRSATEARQ